MRNHKQMNGSQSAPSVQSEGSRHGRPKVRTVLLIPALILSLSTPSPRSVSSELLRSVDEVLAEVSRLRQLEVRSPIKRGVKSRQEIRAFLVERIKREYPPDEMALEQKVLARLGLIPGDLDLFEALLELLTEQVAGFYDPETGVFYIADWIPPEAQRSVMAHELTHALQDQHFNLSRFLERVEGNDDASLARAALIEGEGMAIMLDYLLKPYGQTFLEVPDFVGLGASQRTVLEQEFQAYAKAPAYLRESLSFPYTYGANFVRAFRLRHSWPEASRLYEDLPSSTEQIMHPEKYLDERDEPIPIPDDGKPEALQGDWQRTYRNVLGQFSLLLLLKEFVDGETARVAAEGWGGDVVELYDGTDDRTSLIIRSVWDSEQDAREFFEAYTALVGLKYPDALRTDTAGGPDQGTQIRWRGPGDEILLRRQDRSVKVIERQLKAGP